MERFLGHKAGSAKLTSIISQISMWAQIINSIIGIWLMAAPAALPYNNAGADSCHITGPLVSTFGIVACWEATRGLRKFNIPLGVWFLAAPWVLGYGETMPVINDMTCGILIIIFSTVKGRIQGRYGGGWKALWQS